MLDKIDVIAQSDTTRVACLIDLMGGKPSVNVSNGEVCPTLSKGRGACSDIHSICIVRED